MADPEKIKLEVFLKKQERSRPALLVTIEPVESDKDKIKITPWSQNHGCACASSILIPKNSVESVEITSHEHHCCGKILKVVSLNLKSDATISLADIITQIALKMHASDGHHAPSSIPNSFPNMKYSHTKRQRCGASSYDPNTQCCCCPNGNPNNCYPKDNSFQQDCYYVCGGS